MEEFTNVGEWRKGKGRKSRMGPRIPISRIDTEEMRTPNGIALKKLENKLSKRNLERATITHFINIMRHAEQLRFMNMDVLAEVILFMLTGLPFDNYEYLYTQHISVLLPAETNITGVVKKKAPTKNEIAVASIRMTATFYRYRLYIQTLINKEEERTKRLRTIRPIESLPTELIE